MIFKFNELFENVQQSKSILNKLNIPLDDEDYQIIRGMLEKTPGWVGVFTKFRYEQDVDIEALATLYDDLTRLRPLLGRLPKTVDRYDSHEKLVDDLIRLQSQHQATQLFKELNKQQQAEFKAAGDEGMERLIELAPMFYSLDQHVQAGFLKKMRANTGANFLQRLEYYIDSQTTGFNMETVVEAVRNAPGARLVHQDEENNYLIVELKTFAASMALSGATLWCIRNNISNWNDYAGLGTFNRQYSIYNFNVKLSDIHSMLGVTISIDPNRPVHTAHWKNDAYAANDMASYFGADWAGLKKHLKPLPTDEIAGRKEYLAAAKTIEQYNKAEPMGSATDKGIAYRAVQAAADKLRLSYPDYVDYSLLLRVAVRIDSVPMLQELLRDEKEALLAIGFEYKTFSLGPLTGTYNVLTALAAKCKSESVLAYLMDLKASINLSAFNTLVQDATLPKGQTTYNYAAGKAAALKYYQYQKSTGHPILFLESMLKLAIQSDDVEWLEQVLAENREQFVADGFEYDTYIYNGSRYDDNLLSTALQCQSPKMVAHLMRKGVPIEPSRYADFVALDGIDATKESRARVSQRLRELYQMLTTDENYEDWSIKGFVKAIVQADDVAMLKQLMEEQRDKLMYHDFDEHTLSFKNAFSVWGEAAIKDKREIIKYLIGKHTPIIHADQHDVGKYLLRDKNLEGCMYFYKANNAALYKDDIVKLVVKTKKVKVYNKFVGSIRLDDNQIMYDICDAYEKLGVKLGVDPEYTEVFKNATYFSIGTYLKALAYTKAPKNIFYDEFLRVKDKVKDNYEAVIATRLAEIGKISDAAAVMLDYRGDGPIHLASQNSRIHYPKFVAQDLLKAGNYKAVAALLRKGAMSLEALIDDNMDELPKVLQTLADMGGKLKGELVMGALDYASSKRYIDFTELTRMFYPMKDSLPLARCGHLALAAYLDGDDQNWLLRYLCLDKHVTYDETARRLVLTYPDFGSSGLMRLFQNTYGYGFSVAAKPTEFRTHLDRKDYPFDKDFAKLNKANLAALQAILAQRGYKAAKPFEIQNTLWSRPGEGQQDLTDVREALGEALFQSYEQDAISLMWQSQFNAMLKIFSQVGDGFFHKEGKRTVFRIGLPVNFFQRYLTSARIITEMSSKHGADKGFNVIELIRAMMDADMVNEIRVGRMNLVLSPETYNEHVEDALRALGKKKKGGV